MRSPVTSGGGGGVRHLPFPPRIFEKIKIEKKKKEVYRNLFFLNILLP
jgi:hypothetical protein